MRLRAWAILIGFIVVVFAGLYLWWDIDVRWRPHQIKSRQADIAKLLEGAGWVSPGLGGPKLYVIATRDCPACDAYETSEFPRLQKAGVDTRVIMIAPPDVNGAAKSTPAERATVAELWVNRSWGLFQTWTSVPPADWKAPHIPPADGDAARTAVIAAGRGLVDSLRPLLGANGVKPGYPTLIWWAKDGSLNACLCTASQTYPYVRRDLGAD